MTQEHPVRTLAEAKSIIDAVRVGMEALENDIDIVYQDYRPGHLCPKCGSDSTTVIDTRYNQDFKWRRRACLDCGAKFRTTEILIEEDSV